MTKLHWEAANGNTKVVKLLLKEGENVDVKDTSNDMTPLHAATMFGYAEVAKLLLERGADVNAKKEDGVTPLHYASFNGYTEIVKLLLERDVKINVEDENGETPFDYASDQAHIDIMKILNLVVMERRRKFMRERIEKFSVMTKIPCIICIRAFEIGIPQAMKPVCIGTSKYI